MPRSWSSPLGGVLLFSCLALLTVAAPVPVGSSLPDVSSRYLAGVGDQRGSIVAEFCERQSPSRRAIGGAADEHRCCGLVVPAPAAKRDGGVGALAMEFTRIIDVERHGVKGAPGPSVTTPPKKPTVTPAKKGPGRDVQPVGGAHKKLLNQQPVGSLEQR